MVQKDKNLLTSILIFVWSNLSDILFNACKTNNCAVTVADTGLPGRANIYLILPLKLHVANVVGFLLKNNQIYITSSFDLIHFI